MNRRTLWLVLCIVPLAVVAVIECIAAVGRRDRAAALVVRFQPETVEFGLVPVGAPLQGSVVVINTSDGHVELGAPRSDCGCVNVRVAGSSLAVGESTVLSFELRPSSDRHQLRNIDVTDDRGAVLGRLSVTCSVAPTLVVAPEVLHAGWIGAEAENVPVRLVIGCPRLDADPKLDAWDLDVEVRGDLQLATVPTTHGMSEDRVNLEFGVAPRDARLFGALEATVHLASKTNPSLRGMSRVLLERMPPGVREGWPSCHLSRSSNSERTTQRFPFATSPVIESAQDPYDGGRASPWCADSDGWLLAMDAWNEQPEEDGIADLEIAHGTLRIRLPRAAP